MITYRDYTIRTVRQFKGAWLASIYRPDGRFYGNTGGTTKRHAQARAKADVYHETAARLIEYAYVPPGVSRWWYDHDAESRAHYRKRRATRRSMWRGGKVDAANTADWFKLRAKGNSWATLARRDVEALEMLYATD